MRAPSQAIAPATGELAAPGTLPRFEQYFLSSGEYPGIMGTNEVYLTTFGSPDNWGIYSLPVNS